MPSDKGNVYYYDEECAICKNYTAYLEKKDTSGKDIRAALQTGLPVEIDANRAKNELALLDSKTGDVKYGIETIFYFLKSKWPGLTHILDKRISLSAGRFFYSLFSYNRRAISGGSKCEWQDTFAPDFNLLYRSIFSFLIGFFGLMIGYSSGFFSIVNDRNALFIFLVPFISFIFLFALLRKYILYALNITALVFFLSIVIAIIGYKFFILIGFQYIQEQSKYIIIVFILCTVFFYQMRFSLLGLTKYHALMLLFVILLFYFFMLWI